MKTNNLYRVLKLKFLAVNKSEIILHGGYFEVLFAFVVGLVSLGRKECAIGLLKNVLTLSF